MNTTDNTPSTSPDCIGPEAQRGVRWPWWIVLAGTGAALLFGFFQNQGAFVGGPISVAKILWLNFALAVFIFWPGCLAFNRALPRALRGIFIVAFASFLIRGIIELYIIYATRLWECIYGISHNLLTLALVGGLATVASRRGRLGSGVRFAGTRAFLLLYLLALLIESFMAWRFSLLASPAEGIYFASTEAAFDNINRITWAVVVIVYPALGWILWRSKKDFS